MFHRRPRAGEDRHGPVLRPQRLDHPGHRRLREDDHVHASGQVAQRRADQFVMPGAIAAQPQNEGLVGFADIPIVDELQLSKDLPA